MSTIRLGAEVPTLKVYRKLEEEYFSFVEQQILNKLSPHILFHPDRREGAILRIRSELGLLVKKLHSMIPGAEIVWDDDKGVRARVGPEYKGYQLVLVDPVDGGNSQLSKNGTNVSSNLSIIYKNGDGSYNYSLNVASFPFSGNRAVNFDGKVYLLPFEISDELNIETNDIEDYRLNPRKDRDNPSDLRIAELYEVFPGLGESDPMRKGLDELRGILNGPMVRPEGSGTVTLLSLILGTRDIVVYKRRNGSPIKDYDYIGPRQMIRDLGGKFTPLSGNDEHGLEPMDGIIAASTVNNYNMFMEYINSRK